MTAAATWRRRRALTIFAVYARPFTQRDLATVFDLCPSGLARILRLLAAESGLPATAATADARAAWAAEQLQGMHSRRTDGLIPARGASPDRWRSGWPRL